jgi:hypothetical protein
MDIMVDINIKAEANTSSVNTGIFSNGPIKSTNITAIFIKTALRKNPKD